MEAAISNLNNKLHEILKALEMNEHINLLHQGQIRGIFTPVSNTNVKKVEDHPFFGMCKKSTETVEDQMSRLRRDRYHDI